jgi:hypothetical protein
MLHEVNGSQGMVYLINHSLCYCTVPEGMYALMLYFQEFLLLYLVVSTHMGMAVM